MNHTPIHYAVGIAALAASLYSVNLGHKHVDVSIAPQSSEEKVGRNEWAPLGQDTSIKLGEALHDVNPGKVTIYCANQHCKRLASDLDDAFQIGLWYPDLEDRPVDSESDQGIFVGPPGARAEQIGALIKDATGVQPQIVAIDSIDGVGIILGKKGK